MRLDAMPAEMTLPPDSTRQTPPHGGNGERAASIEGYLGLPRLARMSWGVRVGQGPFIAALRISHEEECHITGGCRGCLSVGGIGDVLWF